jgi:hypothetical protein
MKVVAENRREIYVSVGVAVVGIILGAHVPLGYQDVLLLSGCLLVALFCAVNAALDVDSMSIPGMYFTVIWLIVMLLVTAWFHIWAFGIREFPNR